MLWTLAVFPARAGMSPIMGAVALGLVGVPRASGDEPMAGERVITGITCSPRERG